MNLAEIEQEIKPLDRLEKVKLIHFLVDEIARDELDPAHYFKPGSAVCWQLTSVPDSYGGNWATR